ncbi:chain-length determining protein [Apilactobacillus timberlakei]|nr:chain-length determining protein [Apilactobacillus timberlakei]TPR20940.1 chain-length determining protein [Apilactobacillus timberlakei]TPR23591.1 chain-length determining protein [Apilactobacillus timberlakei]
MFFLNTEDSNSLEELSNIFKMLLKHIKLIITVTIITVAIFAIAVLFVIKPKYQSTNEIIVNQKITKSNNQYSELQQAQSTDLQLVNTYKTILNSQTVSNNVAKNIGKNIYNQTNISVNTDPTSQVISISATAHNPKLAAKVANETANVFRNKVRNIMNINNVSIISKATPNKTPTFPKKSLSLIAGVFVGIILGILLALLREYSDKTIKNMDYVTNELGLTDLGKINDIDMKLIKKNVKR